MPPFIAQHGSELELMFRCARLELHDEDRIRIGKLLDDGIDWHGFLQTVERAHVAPLINRTFQSIHHPALPGKVSETVRVRTKITTWKNERFAAELAALDAALQREDLHVLHYKGAAAAARLYGDIRLRSFNDCDFLVKRSELHRVLEAMERQGYQRAFEIDAAEQDHSEKEFKEYLYVRDDFRVEPHWSLTARRYPFDINYPELWSRATRFRVNDHDLLVMDPEDECLVLCIAAGKGWWKRYQMVTDIAQCTVVNPGLDWDRLLVRAGAAGAKRIVLLSAFLAAELAGADVPDRVLRQARSSPAVRRLAAHAARSFAGPVPSRKWLPDGPQIIRRDLLAMRERPGDRIKYLWRTATTATIQHRRLYRLPRSLEWLYVVLVPAHDYVAFPAYSLVRRLAPSLIARGKSATLNRLQAPRQD